MSDTMTADTASAPEDGAQSSPPPLFLPIRHVVRLTVEAVTPLSPSSGEVDGDTDAPLFRDWNGLPCLSGAAVAGVIRSLYGDYFGAKAREHLFGFEENRDQRGAASRLMVSFGLVHGADDKPVEGYRGPGDGDAVLGLLRGDAPILRDHVKIDERGVADAHHLFDRVSCPRGARFTLELALDGEPANATGDKEALLNAVRMIEAPQARFGAAGRRGLGRLEIVRDGDGKEPRVFYAEIDRRDKDGRANWENYRKAGFGRALPQPLFRGLAEADLQRASASVRGPVTGELRLTAKAFWRLGQGGGTWLQQAEGDEAKAPDVSPPREPVIDWEAGDRKVVEEAMAPVPASGVKGAIAHRTEFHLRRIKGLWADAGGGQAAAGDEGSRIADDVFGAMRTKDEGFAGALFLDDAYVDFGPVDADKRVGRRTRNSIDRHTGGVRLGPLFTDEVLWQGPELVIPFVLLSRVPRLSQDGAPDARREPAEGSGGESPFMPTPPEAIKALAWALEDLCEGRLALGAREGTGDGVFTGRLTRPGGEGSLNLIEEVQKAAAAAEAVEKDIRRKEKESEQAREDDEQAPAPPAGAGREAA